ncbi:hypothetical protein P3T40_008777 [Paraburkholderia sp. EB58]
MSLIKLIARLLLLAGLMLVGRTAIAGPLHCAYGNQDSTCVPTISAAWQAPPTCSIAPGWTTVTPATWIGSQYTTPQCNYQAQPVCPADDITTSPAAWNGLQWVGLGCQPQAQTPPPSDPMTACESSVPGGFTLTNFLNSNAHNSQYPSDTGLEFGGRGPNTPRSAIHRTPTSSFVSSHRAEGWIRGKRGLVRDPREIAVVTDWHQRLSGRSAFCGASSSYRVTVAFSACEAFPD